MRRPIVLAVAALLLGGCTLARELNSTTCPSSRRLEPAVADYVDFVQAGGITYHAGMRGPAGRELRDADLGARHSVVRCKLADHRPEGPGNLDGDAAYLDQGTALYEVRGYRPSFRLTARRDARSPLGTGRTCPDRRNLVLAFHLDGTATALAYDVPSRRLDCRHPLPGPFGAAVQAALP